MSHSLFPALIAFAVALLLTPLVRVLANRLNAVATPNHRSVHQEAIPKLGGLSIFLAFTLGVLVYSSSEMNLEFLYGIGIGGAMLVIVGFFDDLYTLSCYKKLFVQITAASFAVFFGIRIETVDLPYWGSIELGWFFIPVSLLWIVGITNAINLLDGLDGLASGFSILLCLLILIVSGFVQDLFLASLSLILIASTLGFLKYNFPPAKIFMGDTGSLFLGFSIACLSIEAFTFSTTGTNLAALLIPFSLPLTDTLLAIVRRTSRGDHPFSADKKHIHHRLLDLGYNQSLAVIIIYAVTVVFSVVGFLSLFIDIYFTALFVLAAFTAFAVGLFRLDCFDFIVKRQRLQERKEIKMEQGPVINLKNREASVTPE